MTEDYQLGVHDIDKTPSLGGEEDFIEFQFESAAIFKRLADDIYESNEAGIREPLSNGITAVRRAEREFDIDNGVIEITLERDTDGGHTLTISDNGIGISTSVLEQVLSVIGRSMNRDEGGLSGKYGMGFLACYKLVGTDGGFIMHTRSRETGEYTSGIWKPGGFDRDTDNQLAGGFEEDEYGTELKFPLQESITSSQVRQWVENHAYWSRIPIVFQEFDEDGSELRNEDYGMNKLEEQYQNGNDIVIDTPYFKAVASDTAKEKTILLDSPISRNARGKYGSPWRFDIRLKNENGVVVSGPHEGLMPVSEEEYKSMDEGRKGSYVPESKLVEDDVCLPSPIGTRDKLESNREFWNWLGSQLTERYQKMVSKRVEGIKTMDDFLNMSDERLNFISSGFRNMSLWMASVDDFQKKAKSTLGVDIPDEVAQVFNDLRLRIHKVKRDANANKASKGKTGHINRTDLATVLREAGNEGQVYMGVSLNQQKCEVVWEDHEQNVVITVDSSDKYDEYQEKFGWEKLKQVSSNIEDFDVEDDLAEAFKGSSTTSTTGRNSGLDAPDREITIHTNGTSKKIVEDIADRFDDDDRPDSYRKLVLFPSNAEENLSDYKWLASSNVGLANCIVKVWDYLKEYDAVTRIEDYRSAHEELEVFTSEGVMAVAEAGKRGKLVFHVVRDDYKQVFKKDVVIEGLKETFINSINSLDTYETDELVYAPVTTEELDEIRPFLNDDTDHRVVQGSWNYHLTRANRSSINGDMYPYACAIMPEWEDTDELDMFKTNLNTMNESNLELANTLKQLHDEGVEPESADPTTYYDPMDTMFHTSKGHITLREAIDTGKPVFHILDSEDVERFTQSDEMLSRLKAHVVENASKRFNSSATLSEHTDEEIVYIPATKSKYKEISNCLDDPVYIKGAGRVNGDEFRVGRTYYAYAHARLHNWVDTPEFKALDTRLDDTNAYNLIETLGELHDRGADPESMRSAE